MYKIQECGIELDGYPICLQHITITRLAHVLNRRAALQLLLGFSGEVAILNFEAQEQNLIS